MNGYRITDNSEAFVQAFGKEVARYAGVTVRMQVFRDTEVSNCYLLRTIFPMGADFNGASDMAVDFMVYDFGDILEMNLLKVRLVDEIKRCRETQGS